MATISDKANEVIDRGADAADTAIIGAAEAASHATARAKHLAHDAVDSGRDTLEGALICTKDLVRANPFASVVIVAAAAYLWGRLQR